MNPTECLTIGLLAGLALGFAVGVLVVGLCKSDEPKESKQGGINDLRGN